MNNELIEAATAVIARWDSTDWKAAPTAEVMNRLRAALSKEPAKLPEVEEWIKLVEIPADTAVSTTEWVIRTDYVRSRMQQLTAAHAAELADLSYQIFKQREENVRLVEVIARKNGAEELAAAKARREALMEVPVDALIYATLLLRLEAGNMESVVSSKTVSEYDRQISRLIESVRAAQQEETK